LDSRLLSLGGSRLVVSVLHDSAVDGKERMRVTSVPREPFCVGIFMRINLSGTTPASSRRREVDRAD
jgi:hypothetical protein